MKLNYIMNKVFVSNLHIIRSSTYVHNNMFSTHSYAKCIQYNEELQIYRVFVFSN